VRAPSPTLPRKRGRGRTESVARALESQTAMHHRPLVVARGLRLLVNASKRGSGAPGNAGACEACRFLLRSRKRAARRSACGIFRPRAALAYPGDQTGPLASSSHTGRIAGRAESRSRPGAQLTRPSAQAPRKRSSWRIAPEVSGPHLQPVPPACPTQATPREGAPRGAGSRQYANDPILGQEHQSQNNPTRFSRRTRTNSAARTEPSRPRARPCLLEQHCRRFLFVRPKRRKKHRRWKRSGPRWSDSP
jgi:hypothetical protein